MERRGEDIPRSSKVPGLWVKKHLGSWSCPRHLLTLHGQGWTTPVKLFLNPQPIASWAKETGCCKSLMCCPAIENIPNGSFPSTFNPTFPILKNNTLSISHTCSYIFTFLHRTDSCKSFLQSLSPLLYHSHFIQIHSCSHHFLLLSLEVSLLLKLMNSFQFLLAVPTVSETASTHSDLVMLSLFMIPFLIFLFLAALFQSLL